MKQLWLTIKKHTLLFLVFAFLWLIGLMLVIVFPKSDLHLWLNGWHTGIGDFFYKNYTGFNVWGPVLAIVVLLVFSNYRNALYVLSSVTVASLLTNIVKRIFNTPRPALYFQNLNLAFPHVDGVTLYHHYSFPSGHTTAFFSLFFVLAFLTRKKWLQLIYLLLAVLGAYSRIYLSQHFLDDVLGGAFIGVAVSLVLSPIFLGKKWGNGNLMHVLYRKPLSL